MTEAILHKLWAKSDPYHPLWCHLLDVAAVARALKPRFGEIEGLEEGWIEWLVGVHDVGKADDWFQNKDAAASKFLRDIGVSLPLHKASEPDCYRLFRHEARSQQWVLRWLQNERGWDWDAATIVARAIVGHHGDWQPANFYGENSDQSAFWQPLRDQLGELVWTVIQPKPLALQTFPHAGAAGAKLSAYVVLSDWIASNDHLFPYKFLSHDGGPEEYFGQACDLAERVVKQMKLDAPAQLEYFRTPLLREVWQTITSQRPLQSALEERRDALPPGLAIIEAPTGEGKTEAAIYLAQIWDGGRQRGLYFALPTQATSNAMFKRYRKFLRAWRPQARARLVHGMAWLREDSGLQIDKSTWENAEFLPQLDAQEDIQRAKQQARNARDWFRPTRRALLSEHGVGTVDQALLCALRVKFGTLRLLGLSQKTLIVDEVHAYDEFMSAILERLLQWCRALEVNVILLSATLTHDQKLALTRAYRAYIGAEAKSDALDVAVPREAPYPLLTFVPLKAEPFVLMAPAAPERAVTLSIEVCDGLLEDFEATARLAAQKVQKGGCLCVLANTVGGAQEIYRVLRVMQETCGLRSDCRLDLFHARFRAKARTKIESRVVESFGPENLNSPKGQTPRPPCSILVATQVVEQSLDVDFDFLLSQIAPLDLLLQRAGRLWRHARASRPCDAPVLTVLAPQKDQLKFGATGKVYQDEILLRTLALLHGKSKVWNLPQDFRPLIEDCYRRDAPLGDFALLDGFSSHLTAAEQKRDDARTEAKNEAGTHLWIKPSPEDFEPVGRTQQEPDEDGGKAQKYFIARTRLGDESVAILAIASPELFQEAQKDLENAKLPRRDQKSPPRRVLTQLFGCKVGIPRWWLFEKEKPALPMEGFEPFFEGKSFLQGHIVLPLREVDGESIWQGQTPRGRFAIIEHPELGLLRRSLEATLSPDTHVDADAGQTPTA